MHSSLRMLREKFHPLFYLRKSALGRNAIRFVDCPVMLSVPGIRFKVCGRLITHGLAFAATGSQEQGSEALALTCIRQLELRSFWDVGANIGHYTWLLKSASPDLEAVLFEPFPANIALIRKTLKVHGFADVTLITAGASKHSGTATLHTDSVAGATSSLETAGKTFEERHFGVSSKPLTIATVSIDDVRAQRRRVDFLKIDVEGHEEHALQGAEKTIATDQPVVFIECGHAGHSCLTELENQGYQFVDGDQLTYERTSKTINHFGFPRRFKSRIDDLLQVARNEVPSAVLSQ